jgi:hypothetical protein
MISEMHETTIYVTKDGKQLSVDEFFFAENEITAVGNKYHIVEVIRNCVYFSCLV